MWKSNKHPEDGEVVVLDETTGNLIAEIYSYAGSADEIGALVAAAPSLRAALQNLADACDNVGVKYFDTDSMSEEVEAMQEATIAARAVIEQSEVN